MKKELYGLPYWVLISLFGLSMSACNQGGEGKELYKAYNKDKNDFLDDKEFYNAVAEEKYFDRWNQNGDRSLSEDEWSAGVNDYLGGYKVSTVEKFGEWDLNGDSQVSEEEFREGLFEVVDKDQNRQISQSEFTSWTKEGGGQGSRSGS
ncbi:hypothetical protein [Pontibacter rugosus]|uniref:EF-hand domain-containing protein n=1 Tax=Pontibacter rugosus TaxID=1745966 RepID=A0ABW3SQM1_9BACT